MTSIAIGTSGSYYHANNVNQLYGIFDSIADQSDLGKDTDGDGYSDPTDEYPLYPNPYKYLGDEGYFQYLDKELISVKNESWKYGSSASSYIAGHAVKIMIRDYYKYKNPDSIPDSYWDKYCNQFNSYVRSYGDVYQELHYFRNNLNRAPSSLEKMISTINSASGSTWRLLSVGDSLYHMYGENGEYNLKFVSSDGKYEGVYNKNGTELTEVNDPVNMGTYNYADPSDTLEHTYFDVITYLGWGNTRDSVEDCKKAAAATGLVTTLFKFNQNNAAKSHRSQIENRIQ